MKMRIWVAMVVAMVGMCPDAWTQERQGSGSSSTPDQNIYVDPVKGIDGGNTSFGPLHPYRTIGWAVEPALSNYAYNSVIPAPKTIFLLPGTCVETNFDSGANPNNLQLPPAWNIHGSGMGESIITNVSYLYANGDAEYSDFTLYAPVVIGGAKNYLNRLHLITTNDGIDFANGAVAGTTPNCVRITGCVIQSWGRGVEIEDPLPSNDTSDTNASYIRDSQIVVRSPLTNLLSYGISMEQAASGILSVENCKIDVAGAKTNFCVFVTTTNSLMRLRGNTYASTNPIAGYDPNRIATIRLPYVGSVITGIAFGVFSNWCIQSYDFGIPISQVYGGSVTNTGTSQGIITPLATNNIFAHVTNGIVTFTTAP